MTVQPSFVSSRDNPQVKRLLRLASSSRERRESGTTILDGEHLVQAYQRSGGKADVLVASETALVNPVLKRLFEETPAEQRLILADRLVARIAQVVTSTGILAVVHTPAAPAIPDEILDCLLLEGIQDPGNLGSILRSAAAAGIRRVFLSPGSVFAWAPKVVRAGQGAHFALVIHEDVPFTSLRARMRGRVIATEPRAPDSVFVSDLRSPVAWLFGNEGAGLSTEAAALADLRLCIPMPGDAESLNVASAVAVCLFEQVRQRS